jgi:uncharacterized membrane protein YgcG
MMKLFKTAAIAALMLLALAAPAEARKPVVKAAPVEVPSEVIPAPAPAQVAVPKTVSAVLDTAGALDAEQLADLQSIVSMNEVRTGVQILVVVSPTLGGKTAGVFTEEVKNKIAFSKQKKPTVLFTVAVAEKAATITASPGIKQLSAKAQNAIVERIVLPNFRLEKIGTGVYDGTRAISLALQVPVVTQVTQIEEESSNILTRWLPLIVLGVFLVGFGNSDWNRGGYYGTPPGTGGYNGRDYGGGSRRY